MTRRFRYSILAMLAGTLLVAPAVAQNLHLGDVDDDGVVTVRDIALVVEHVNEIVPLEEHPAILADVTRDGAVNQADVDELVKEVLQTRNPEDLPLSTVRYTSPASGEGDVSVNRETIIHFTVPLSIGASLDTTKFFAEFADRRLLCRAEVSSDRRKATLFYLEPLPANSRIRVTLDGTGLTDLIGRPFDGDSDGLPGGIFQMTFDTHANASIPGTGITGRVIQAAPEGSATVPEGFADVGIPGVTVTVDGQEQTMRAVTDAQGYFTLSPCPTGTFFVHIDGRTSPLSQYPSGQYFPNVGKKWDALAGKADNLSGSSEDSARGKIYLPCICTNTLKPVSITQTTEVGFPAEVLAENPELAGTNFTFPPNTAFADDGTRGGALGPVPVPPDRLPSPLPEGLRLPFVFSLQTDGPTNFERPVGVTLPNLPEPETGYLPVPGEKCALVAFNHDTGQWEVVGPMTVTEDGKFLKSDPGVGLRQPGWGGGTARGTAPGSGGDGRIGDACDVLAEKLVRAGRATEEAAEDLAERVDPWFSDSADDQTSDKLETGLDAMQILIEEGVDFFGDGRTRPVKRINKMFQFVDYEEATAESINCYKDLTDDTLSTWDAAVGADCRAALLDSAAVASKKVAKTAGGITFGLGSEALGTWIDYWNGLGASDDWEEAFEAHEDCVRNRPDLERAREFWEPIMRDAVDKARYYVNRTAQELTAQQPARVRLSEKAPRVQQLGEKIEKYINDPNQPKPTNGEVKEFAVKSTEVIDDLKFVLNRPSMSLLIEEAFYRIEDFKHKFTGGHAAFRPPAPAIPNGKFYCMVKSGPLEERFTTTVPFYSRILRPGSYHSIRVMESGSFRVGMSFFKSPSAGGRATIPAVTMGKDDSIDSDGDGLGISAEEILGTSPTRPDTDNDGISDGAELKNGSDPLSGLAVSSGIIARAPLSGTCVDLAAGRDVLAAACGTEGVYLLGMRQGLTPTRLSRIPTGPAAAEMVAISSSFLAIGIGSEGTMIVDISAPDTPVVTRTIKLGSSVRSLAASEGLLHVGLADGRIAMIDLVTGRLIGSVNLGSAPHDLALGRRVVYAVMPGSVGAVQFSPGGYGATSSAVFSGNVPNTTARHRLFRGNQRLYAVHRSGVTVYDITNPSSPVLMQDNPTTALGWSHFVPTGSNLAVACLGANNPDDVSLYDLGANGAEPTFLTTFSTPGSARAATIYNGIAYVADGTEGVQVVNFRAFDTLGVPPTVSIELSSANPTAEEGAFLPVLVNATDDVQIRNVEYLIDGQVVDTDGNYPFDGRLVAPRLEPGKTSFTLQARAYDTGGNSAITDIVTINLTADTSKPAVLSFYPSNGAIVSKIGGFSVQFTEAVAASSINSTTVYLTEAGPDGFPGNGDDVRIPVSLVASADGNGEYLETASLQTGNLLSPGKYRALLTPGISDRKGNGLTAPYSAMFQVINAIDSDGDGVPDDFEVLLGMSADNIDSDGDGVPDGNEDYDGDSLRNAWEIHFGLNPRLPDSNNNGTTDSQEDPDLDTLKNVDEMNVGSDPSLADTDGDGWPDQAEVELGSNPSDAGARPITTTLSMPETTVTVVNGGTTLATPDVTVTIVNGAPVFASPAVNVRIEQTPP